MNARRLQGLALIASAVCFLLGLFGPQSLSLIGPQATGFFVIAGILLFIVGIPAVNSAQPTGTIGLAGIGLLMLASLIALLFRLKLVPSGLEGSLSLTSAIAGMLGALITGWLTIREGVFPAWLGWVLIAQGLLNIIAGAINVGPLTGLVPIFIPLLVVVVYFAYGYFLYQNTAKPAVARKLPVA